MVFLILKPYIALKFLKSWIWDEDLLEKCSLIQVKLLLFVLIGYSIIQVKKKNQKKNGSLTTKMGVKCQDNCLYG